jgi:hypothetical protein
LTTGELAARTWAELRAPRWWRFGLLWFAIAFFAELAIANSHPPKGRGVYLLFALIGIAFVLVEWTTVAVLRLAAASARSLWRVDGSLLLSFGLNAAISATALSFAPLMDETSPFAALLASAALQAVLTAPLAPWLVAVAVERPLALSPWRFLKQADGWLVPLLLLTLLLLLPLQMGQLWASMAILTSGSGTIEFTLAYAGLVALSAMIGVALALVAYRSVAEG